MSAIVSTRNRTLHISNELFITLVLKSVKLLLNAREVSLMSKNVSYSWNITASNTHNN